MAIRSYKGIKPQIANSAYIDEAAAIIGDVVIGEECSVWPMAVARGDVNCIRIGNRSNIQDGSALHVTHDHGDAPGGFPLLIGDDVTVGHNVTLHGCTIGNRCLIGMGAVVLDGAVLEDEVLLAAGSLVPPGKTLEGGYIWLGNPVKKGRPLNQEEIAWFTYSAEHYSRLREDYRKE
jgi:carbonic anhydrase/acetyltransferase-like protein (isoleucine patch superfamily)